MTVTEPYRERSFRFELNYCHYGPLVLLVCTLLEAARTHWAHFVFGTGGLPLRLGAFLLDVHSDSVSFSVSVDPRSLFFRVASIV